MLKKIGGSIRYLLVSLSHSLRRISNHILTAIRLFYRSPMSMLLLLVYPIILLLLFGSIFATQDPTFRLEVQDKDQTVLSESLIQNLEEIEILEIHRLQIDEVPREYLQQNGLYACLVIPKGWTADSFDPAVPTANVTLIIDPHSQRAPIISQIVLKVINELNLNRSELSPIIALSTESFDSGRLNYIEFFIPGIIGITVMNAGVMGTINRHIHFRQTGIFLKLATTPITKVEYVLSEVLWQFIIAFVSTFLSFLTAWIAFGLNWYYFDFLIVPLVIVGVMVFSEIGMLIGQLVNDAIAASAIGTLLTFPMMFLSGALFDISNVPALLVISKFLPLTFIVDGLRASMVTNNYSIAWMNIGIAFAIGIVAIVLGTVFTRWRQTKR